MNPTTKKKSRGKSPIISISSEKFLIAPKTKARPSRLRLTRSAYIHKQAEQIQVDTQAQLAEGDTSTLSTRMKQLQDAIDNTVSNQDNELLS